MQSAFDHPPGGYRHVQLSYGPYSASRLIVARCPSRFHSKYILRDSVVSDTLASARGSAIHEVLQLISEAHVRRIAIEGGQINSWVEEAVSRHPASYEQIKLIKDAAVAYVSNANPYLNETTRCEETLAVELYEEESFVEESTPVFAYVKVALADGINPYVGQIGSRIYFTAKLDQLSFDHSNRIITVVDHKSTPSASCNSDHVFQMGCYALMAAIQYPGYHVRTVIHYANPMLNFYSPPTYWDEEDLIDVEEELRMRIRAVEGFASYPALPGSHCDYCHMIHLCPENRKVQEQSARGELNLNINGVEDMVRIAKQLRVTGALYDQLNKKLKESIETSCPDSGIALEGIWYGFKPGEEKVDWVATDRKIRETAQSRRNTAIGNETDPASVEQLATQADSEGLKDLDDLLKKYGVNPESFKEWRNDKLKSLLKLNKPELIDELRSFIVKDKSTRFGCHKI